MYGSIQHIRCHWLLPYYVLADAHQACNKEISTFDCQWVKFQILIRSYVRKIILLESQILNCQQLDSVLQIFPVSFGLIWWLVDGSLRFRWNKKILKWVSSLWTYIFMHAFSNFDFIKYESAMYSITCVCTGLWIMGISISDSLLPSRFFHLNQSEY